MTSTHKIEASVFIATSLDGFIARPDGNIDWLHEGEQIEGEDFGYQAFFDSVDALIMGRNTMQMVLSFGSWPYEDKRVIILSNSLKELPEQLAGKVELYSGPIKDLMAALQGDGCKRVYVDGGKTIQSFLNQSLITDLTITRIPILLGMGISLFEGLEKEVPLKHISTISYENGFVSSRYEIVNKQ